MSTKQGGSMSASEASGSAHRARYMERSATLPQAKHEVCGTGCAA